MAFDSYHYVQHLKKAGFSEAQAAAQADALTQVIDINLATKADIRDLAVAIDRMGDKITIRLGGLVVAGVAVLAAMRVFA
jgi:capsule polysaccharide export protein KpsE/RkpR